MTHIPATRFILFGFNTPRLAAHPVIPKAGIQKKADWMPDQVRHDKSTAIPPCLRRGGLFTDLLFQKKRSRRKTLRLLDV
jgi:hypothetical protein